MIRPWRRKLFKSIMLSTHDFLEWEREFAKEDAEKLVKWVGKYDNDVDYLRTRMKMRWRKELNHK